ncbi:putative RNA-directed DNA polymerase, eukaryota, reverse transcriptase zinc-binding domain protein [Tanacetum coccineum]
MWIKDLCLKHNVHFLGIQESKMTRLELFRIKSMWGNYAFDYACSMARGLSGGLISIWDPNMFSKNSIWCDDSFIIIKGNWKNVVGDCFMVNIYGPQDHVSKLALWNRLTDFMHHHNGSYIMFGDMNAVRNAQERFGTTLNSIEADHFNSFIDSTGLVDLPIGGRSFTWMNKAGTKLSKLDRFLISEDVTIRLPDVRITALDRLWSDHNPILLHIDKTDFGPTPFKLYNSWLLRDGFDNLIKEEWELLDSNLKCHEKFRRLKDKIKQWSNNIKTLERNRKTVALEEINSIEKRIDEGSAMPSDNDHRLILLQEIEKIDKFASMDIIQKAHVKWDIEGDENSKFFHGLINQKRRNQMINGIMVEGNWITNPCLIKDAFLQFYKRKFQAQDSQVMFSNLPHSHSLNCMDRETLERQVTLEEIKEAVWDCGSSKAPGPDGYSFAFVKKYWGTIQKDLYDFVNLFFASCVMPNGANSSFFTLIPKVNNPTLITDFRPISLIGIHYKIIAKILANRLSKVIDKIVSKEQSAFIAGRQILDGPVILSEIIEWYKKRKKKLLIFKVDFEKAFDSISWNYLIHILDSFGFGNKWCSWIKACLNSSRASILINGSPTSEFSIKRGLRQGDPLSPFLFILVMEGLHNAFEEAVGNGLITGVNIKNSTINVSHLFYADDVIITTDWNAKDMDNIIRVLHVFYLASGLKINIHKSNIYGIGVNKDEVLSMASNAGCIAGDIPFNYLGLPIGSNMKSIASWKTLVDRFHMRLSSWKANLLSIGGRLTLIKSVLGSLGGLNIGSLKAFNLALLQKWRWRLLSSPNALWVQGVALRIRFWERYLGGEIPLCKVARFRIDLISCTTLDILLLGINLSPGSPFLQIGNVESANHVFFECDIATDMWKLVFRWCDIPFFQASSWDSFNDWIISWHASKEKKHRFYVITTFGYLVALEDTKLAFRLVSKLREKVIYDNVRLSSFRGFTLGPYEVILVNDCGVQVRWVGVPVRQGFFVVARPPGWGVFLLPK